MQIISRVDSAMTKNGCRQLELKPKALLLFLQQVQVGSGFCERKELFWFYLHMIFV